jgi:adenine phosphoribosyltransferase
MNLQEYIRVINNFPRTWISFKDITPLLASPEAFSYVIDHLSEKIWKVDKIVGLDSRWFIFWSAIAYKLWIPFIPIRKMWKLPFDTIKVDYHLEYGIDSLEIHIDAINKWEKVAIIDDLLATWWTAKASIELVEQLWWNIDSLNFVIDLTFLHGKEKLSWYNINTLLEY